MKCANCNGDFKTPLELYNNELKCPHCLKNVIPETFIISDESEEYFRLSEAAYYSYLEIVSADIKNRVSGGAKRSKSKEDAFNKDISNKIDVAVNYCRRAAYMGHPEAIVKLGYYYDNNLIDYGGNNTDRDKIAKEYYTRVLYDFSSQNVKESSAAKLEQLIDVWDKNSEKNKGRADQKVLEQDRDKIAEKVYALRKRAAFYLLNMLSNISQDLSQKDEYNFDHIRKLLIDCKIITENDFKKSAVQLASSDHSDRVKTLVLGLKPKARTPVFGYYYMTGEELGRFVAWLYEQKGMAKPDISFMPLNIENGNVWVTISHLISKGAITFSRDELDIKDDDCYLLYLLNRNSGGEYAKKRNTIDAAKKLYENFVNIESKRGLGEALNEWLVNEFKDAFASCKSKSDFADAATGHVFYADDFYFLLKNRHGKKGSHLLDAFVDWMK